MDSNLRKLTMASLLYLVSAATGTILALSEHLPARFGGILNGNNVLVDFLTLNGTALSAPLFMLVAQAICTLLAFGTGRSQAAGTIGLTALGAMYVIGQLGEPILYRSLNPATFDPLAAIIVLANLTFSLLMLAFGIAALRDRGILLRREPRSG